MAVISKINATASVSFSVYFLKANFKMEPLYLKLGKNTGFSNMTAMIGDIPILNTGMPLVLALVY